MLSRALFLPEMNFYPVYSPMFHRQLYLFFFLFTAIFFTLLNMLHVILLAIVSRRKVELLENHGSLKLKKVFSWWPLNAFVRDSSCRCVHCPQCLWKTEEKFIGFERFTKYTTWWSLYQYHLTSSSRCVWQEAARRVFNLTLVMTFIS